MHSARKRSSLTRVFLLSSRHFLAHIPRVMTSPFRLWTLLWICALSMAVRGEEPFVFEKNQGRLPKAVLPQRYEVRIVPDLEHAVFAGDETVSLDVRQPVKQIMLHSSGLEISNARL